MLVFFIHGVATTDTKYAAPLELLLKEEFTRRSQSYPHFHSCFWGDVVKDVGKVWNWIDQDLEEYHKKHPQADLQDFFRYQPFRRGLMSEFVGDAITYLNSGRGAKIRELIADHLADFINNNPYETDIHIVAHSLGSVILWDCLFSDRFDSNDAAFKIRALLQGHNNSHKKGHVYLRSITTMGSPILYFNMMLSVHPQQVKSFVNAYQEQPLRWINLIHSSDILAYPLQSSLNLDPSCSIVFQDKFIQTDANPAERAVRNFVKNVEKFVDTISQFAPAVKEAMNLAPMAAGMSDGHTGYWKCQKTAIFITDNILGRKRSREDIPSISLIEAVIAFLKTVPGMTNDWLKASHVIDKTIVELSFRDSSGKIKLCVKPLRIHHVYVFDKNDELKFSGYVGLIHADGLKKAVELIKRDFC